MREFSRKVFGDVLAYVSCRECVGTLLSAQRKACESRWHRGYGQGIIAVIRPWQNSISRFSVRAFLLYKAKLF